MRICDPFNRGRRAVCVVLTFAVDCFPLSQFPRKLLMTPFQIIAAVVTLSAVGAYLNYRFFRLPQTIGLMAFSFAVSLLTLILSRSGIAHFEAVGQFVSGIDFSEVLFHGMLSFLLFAGAMHINLEELRSVRWSSPCWRLLA